MQKAKHIIQRCCMPLVFLLIETCGTMPEWEAADRHFALQAYELALENIDAGLRKEPDESYYQCLEKATKRRLCQKQYENSLQYINAGRLHDAERALENALAYDPEHPGATQKLAAIRKNRQQIEQTIQTAKAQGLEGNWDQAYVALAKILPFQQEFPEIAKLYDISKSSSFQLHYELGQAAFHAQDYTKAVHEFKLALTRLPTSPECLEQQSQSNAFAQAQIFVEKAQNSFQQKDFQQAYEQYQAALQIQPNWTTAAHGLQNTAKAWADSLIQQAEQQALQAQTNKAAAFNALQLYEKAQEISAEERGLSGKISHLKQICSQHLVAEAREWIQNHEWKKITLAYYFLQLATDLYPNTPSLLHLKTVCNKIIHLQIRRHIAISGLPTEATQKLELLQQQEFSSAIFYAQTPAWLQASLSKEQEALQNVLPGADFPIHLYVLELNWTEPEIIEQQVSNKSIVSQYFDGLQDQPNEHWESYSQEIQKLKIELEKLFPQYSAALDHYEIARVALIESRYQKQNANQALQAFQELYHQMQQWNRTFSNRALIASAMANQFESTLRSQVQILSQAFQEASAIFEKRQSLAHTLEQNAKSLKQQISEREIALEKYQRYIAQYRQKGQSEILKSYAWEKYTIQRTAKLEITATLKSSQGNVLENFRHPVQIQFEQTVIRNAHSMDIGQASNIPETIPSKTMLAMETQSRAIAGLYQQILKFSAEWPLPLFQQAMAKDGEESMSQFAEFLILDQGRHVVQNQIAHERLKKFAQGN